MNAAEFDVAEVSIIRLMLQWHEEQLDAIRELKTKTQLNPN